MSDAFSIVPVPAEAEGLDVPYSPGEQTARKYSCDAGVYNAIVTKMEKATVKPGNEGKSPRLKFEVTLTDETVKGIKATRFYDLTGDYQWVLVKAAEAFGVKPVDGVLPLKAAYHQIVAQPCRVKVKPREFNGKTFMDIEQLFPPQAKEAAPF